MQIHTSTTPPAMTAANPAGRPAGVATNVVTLPTRTSPPPASAVGELSLTELEVIFYAANYRRTLDEVMHGPDILTMTQTAITVLTTLGRDTITALATLAEHATQAGNTTLLRRVWPDTGRHNAAAATARAYRRATATLPTGTPPAGLLAGWGHHLATPAGTP